MIASDWMTSAMIDRRDHQWRIPSHRRFPRHTRILEIRRQTLVERLGETHGSGKFSVDNHAYLSAAQPPHGKGMAAEFFPTTSSYLIERPILRTDLDKIDQLSRATWQHGSMSFTSPPFSSRQ
ncbi:uncharacterized protein AFUA_2G05370 [Aspergillus fumigatus Af293]|uniref:Uncharacterized protein n=2 Tax=Aspergillus fumigatus TaxID=746128 RepID=Q4WHH6_ASPFU|nr:hypothetical protein AFUA_2G05370 [Aspergillus fumigatus Af293]EAL87629.1 hypothetical protein AFUA_2G05370 [Aspergillus fumigatus Af293]EDP54188.1 hypothetical protein AFUB_022400 [Aspergillus fumigatus A1163]